MTGGCTCPIYYQEVVGGEKGGVIIRYKLAELIKKVSQVGNPLSRNHVSSVTMVGSRTLLSPQACFQHDRRMYFILPGSC